MAISVETFFLNPDAQGTLQARIQQMIAEGILSGRFHIAEKMPSSRKLAAHLGVARITVTLAYTELVANDYLHARGRSGYFVSENAPVPPVYSPPAKRADKVDWARAIGHNYTGGDTPTKPNDWHKMRYPFIYGQADPTLFDHANWRLCALRALGQKDFAALTGDYFDRDDPLLIEYIARHTLPRRGITARPEEILITMGAQNALWLAAQVLLSGQCRGERWELEFDRAGEVECTHAAKFDDFRKMLDNKEVDVLICAAPDHWHAPATIMACKAGKHVYVEKPCSHNPHEGELAVEAAKKYKRVVQMGNQRRSAAKLIEGIKKIHDGEIGDVHYSRSWYANTRGSVGKRNPTGKPPASLHWDLWQGPAPRIKYDPIYHPYKWHWFWHFGTGEMGNNGIHAIDLSRWGLGVDYPTRVIAGGGRYAFDDDQQTPDTHMVTIDFPGKKTIIWEGLSCNRHGIEGVAGGGFGASFHGSKGTIVLGSAGYTHFSATNREVAKVAGRLNDGDHFANFIKAVRSRKSTDLHADILEGHLSSALCHTSMISHQIGKATNASDITNTVKDMGAFSESWERMQDHLAKNGVAIDKGAVTMGAILEMNPKTERFTNNEAANKLLTRPYRKGFEVPDLAAIAKAFSISKSLTGKF